MKKKEMIKKKILEKYIDWECYPRVPNIINDTIQETAKKIILNDMLREMLKQGIRLDKCYFVKEKLKMKWLE